MSNNPSKLKWGCSPVNLERLQFEIDKNRFNKLREAAMNYPYNPTPPKEESDE